MFYFLYVRILKCAKLCIIYLKYEIKKINHLWILLTNYFEGRCKTTLPVYLHFSLNNYYALKHKVTIRMIGTTHTSVGTRGYQPLIITVTILLQLSENIYIYHN